MALNLATLIKLLIPKRSLTRGESRQVNIAQFTARFVARCIAGVLGSAVIIVPIFLLMISIKEPYLRPSILWSRFKGLNAPAYIGILSALLGPLCLYPLRKWLPGFLCSALLAILLSILFMGAIAQISHAQEQRWVQEIAARFQSALTWQAIRFQFSKVSTSPKTSPA